MAKAKRRCAELTKAGKPCKGTPISATDYTTCLAHAPEEVRDKVRFGGAQKGSGRPPAPRVVDVIRERVESEAEAWYRVLVEARSAQRAVVVAGGKDEPAHVEFYADHATRLAAFREAMDRSYGRPVQATEVTGADGSPLTIDFPFTDREDWNRKVIGIIGEAQSATAAAANGNGNGKG